MTKINKLLQAISQDGGCTIEKADKITGGRDRTYQTVCHLRKQKGYKVVRKGDIYSIGGNASQTLPAKVEGAPAQVSDALSGVKGIPKSMLRKIVALPPQDRADALDMAKKAVFYGLSAAALVQANEFVAQIEEGL